MNPFFYTVPVYIVDVALIFFPDSSIMIAFENSILSRIAPVREDDMRVTISFEEENFKQFKCKS